MSTEPEELNITLTGSGSGIELRALPPEEFNCAEFTLSADMPQPFLVAPWIQFEPGAMSEWRLKMATEVVRRTLAYPVIYKRVTELQALLKDYRDVAERRLAEAHEALVNTQREWAAERKRFGLPEDFSDLEQ